jgi:hypothetical protein
MLREDGNHLPVSPVECPHSVEGPLPVIPHDISNDHNQHTRIKQPYNHHHTYPKNTKYTYSHSSVPHIIQSYNEHHRIKTLLFILNVATHGHPTV